MMFRSLLAGLSAVALSVSASLAADLPARSAPPPVVPVAPVSTLIEPYRTADQAEVRKCLEAQGGLDKCRLAFYQSGDLGNDQVWDNWRLEGPSFVWHYRGTPHVHVWVNIADSSDVKITTRG